MSLILASTSTYRSRLLQRLGQPFECVAPGIDETPLADENAPQLASRLALAKARTVARLNPDRLVIGSDQVASLDGVIVGKPGTCQQAIEQLQASSRKSVVFYTAVALVRETPPLEMNHLEPFTVRFRELSTATIEDYLQREEPYDCAGSFKWEGLGIALFEALQGNDPTSLEGLPLIALSALLNTAGQPVLKI
jgi:septum formation protein